MPLPINSPPNNSPPRVLGSCFLLGSGSCRPHAIEGNLDEEWHCFVVSRASQVMERHPNIFQDDASHCLGLLWRLEASGLHGQHWVLAGDVCAQEPPDTVVHSMRSQTNLLKAAEASGASSWMCCMRISLRQHCVEPN